jgi:thioredoxin reductase (NADPH)
VTQARRFGAEFLLTHEVTAIEHHAGIVGVTLRDGSELRAHSVIIATGVDYRRLDVPGADELTGRGIYYGAAISETSAVPGRTSWTARSPRTTRASSSPDRTSSAPPP